MSMKHYTTIDLGMHTTYIIQCDKRKVSTAVNLKAVTSKMYKTVVYCDNTTSHIFTDKKIHRLPENALDIAVTGEGYLAVQQADGTIAYTRDGSMKLDAQGQLVTSGGEAIVPAIQIPENATSVTIGRDGTVTAELANGGGAAQIGQIQLSLFINNSGLQPVGRNLLKPTEASGDAIVNIPGEGGTGMLMQGSLEASNVNVVEEMVNMIETQRAYEVNSKAISAADGMLKFLNQNL